MRFLAYQDLDTSRVKARLKKVQQAVERGDFRSPDIKKLAQGPYYRAKLSDADRLLLTFVRHEPPGGKPETVCLALEVILGHAYERSRFLRGATIDEARLPDFDEGEAAREAPALRYLHPTRGEFHLLDKPISFDDAQDAVYRTPLPLVVVGSAGSGKTALTLQRLREMPGQVLYVTLSRFLAQSAAGLYAAHGFENDAQEVSFLAFADFLRTVRVPPGREVAFEDFRGWAARQPGVRPGDAHPLFEEFRGVLSSSPAGPLSLEDYAALGVRQSLYPGAERAGVHALYERYRRWLEESGLHDPSLVASAYREEAAPAYDFVVVDEVQDLTAAQLALVLKTLKSPGQFLLCGDSNQIVHPNFFSWAAVRALLHGDPALAERQRVSVLQANFRNSAAVTRVANDILRVKHARFGSVDRESNFLVRASEAVGGSVTFLPDERRVQRHLDEQTRDSAEYAVLVLRDEDRAAARQAFGTPLVFSVHEAKGLEYPNIILHNFVSSSRQAYLDIADGVSRDDLQGDELRYRRSRDKSDKSLELYKFYVNALYVAITRAVQRVILVESDTRHPLLSLLGVPLGDEAEQLGAKKASRDDWEREARKLELQGKREQARDIRRRVLQQREVPWEVWTPAALARKQADAREHPGDVKRARDLTDWALLNLDAPLLHELAELKIRPAQSFLRNDLKNRRVQRQAVLDKYRRPYAVGNAKAVLTDADRYGADHRTPENLTPLMLAALSGQVALTGALLERGADPGQTDVHGRTPHLLALWRALTDADYARTALGPLWALLKPTHLDVQVGGRLLRLPESGAEFYFLSVMLALLPHYTSPLQDPPLAPRDAWERQRGFFVNALQGNLEHFPEGVLRAARRKRSYFNHVLARAEVNSSYVPARRLWQRQQQGYYILNPQMQVRVVLAPDSDGEWVDVGMLADPLARGWLEAGREPG